MSTALQELFMTVYRQPAVLSHRLELAKELTQQNDPRGEFIALQCARKDDEEPSKREKQLLKAHRKDWLGPLLPHVQSAAQVVFRRGFPAVLETASRRGFEHKEVQALPEWATIEELQGFRTAVLSPWMRVLRVAPEVAGWNVDVLLEEGEPWKLEKLSVEFWDPKHAERLRTTQRLPALRSFELRCPAGLERNTVLESVFASQLEELSLPGHLSEENVRCFLQAKSTVFRSLKKLHFPINHRDRTYQAELRMEWDGALADLQLRLAPSVRGLEYLEAIPAEMLRSISIAEGWEKKAQLEDVVAACEKAKQRMPNLRKIDLQPLGGTLQTWEERVAETPVEPADEWVLPFVIPRDLTFTEDGSAVYFREGRYAHRICAVSVPSGKPLGKPSEKRWTELASSKHIESMALLAKYNLLAYVSGHLLHVVSLSGEKPTQHCRYQEGVALRISAAPDGSQWALSTHQNNVLLLSPETLELQACLQLKQQALLVCFSNTSGELLVSTFDRTALARNGKWVRGALEPKMQGTTPRALSPDGVHLLLGPYQYTEQEPQTWGLWNVRTHTQQALPWKNVSWAGFLADGTLVQLEQWKLSFYSVPSLQCTHSILVRELQERSDAPAFSRDGRVLAVGTKERIHFFDTRTGDALV